MSVRTDSYTAVLNDDGTTTTTEVTTYTPPTKGETIAAYGAVAAGVAVVLGVSLAPIWIEGWIEKREAKKLAKQAQKAE